MKLRRFVEAGGSVNKIAVAGTVLGTKNPLSSNIEENTDNITLPSNPIVSAETSAKTAGIWEKDYHINLKSTINPIPI